MRGKASNVSTYEVGDDTVEGAALVAEALLASAQGAEVLSSLGNNISAQFHGNAAESGGASAHVEEDLGVGLSGHVVDGMKTVVATPGA